MMEDILLVSDRLYSGFLNCPNKYGQLFGYDFNVVKSSLLPVELNYDACDIETKKDIKIPSGEFIHAMVINKGIIVENITLCQP